MPLDCGGSYRFEALGAALFERVTGDDPTSIVGLPLLSVARLLERSGVPPPGRRLIFSHLARSGLRKSCRSAPST